MTTEMQQLVRDTVEITGAAAPQLLDGQFPILDEAALADEPFYLVGMIGGKDVGKSALVNALIGQKITPSTSHGAGTETVIAYAHEKTAKPLAQLLEQVVAGQYRILTHRQGNLSRQVLLDLPDIDSHYKSHVELTLRMLRHLLYPVWVQSIEKYADARPQELLAKVMQGNSAANFIFCLNKLDQLGGNILAGDELRLDYSERIGRALGIASPRVWMISAARPGEFDLPELAALLAQEKPAQDVKESRQLAVRQQARSVGQWLEKQNLPGRQQRLVRLEEEAQELVSDRIGIPLLEQSLPALSDDPATRLALTDEVLAMRCRRWPIVSLVQTLLMPVLAVIRRNVGAVRTASLPDAEALVDAHLQNGGTPLAGRISSTFAQLQQSQPAISEVYQERKYWEAMNADTAAATLRMRLTETVSAQRDAVREKLGGRRAIFTAPLRWLLTIGAVIWFPFAQPVCQTILTEPITRSWRDVAILTVRVISVDQLLSNLTFLSMYFFVLWIVLRWDTQRKVARLSRRWIDQNSDLSLARVAVEWMDDLLAPIQRARQRVDAVAERVLMLHKVTE